MITIRHDDDVRCRGHIICAPRKFVYEGYNCYVHIVEDCSKVWVFINCVYSSNPNIKNVCLPLEYKLYSNSKGLYFNFKKHRIYLCD